MTDFYAILGLTKTASAEEIKKAYKKKSREFHPDVNQGDLEAEQKFKNVQEAYEVLSDPVKKSMFDGGGHNMHFRSRSPNNSQPSSQFEEIMEGFFGGSTYRGRSIQIRIEIELKEAHSGCVKHVKIKKRKRCVGCNGHGYTGFQPCTNCNATGTVQVADAPFEFKTTCQVCGGTGKAATVKCGDCDGSCYAPGFEEKALNINIPAGIDNGMQMRLSGEGEESVRGGRPGDAIVFVLVKDHPIFSREGMNLTVEVPVSYTQLVLGGEIEVPTLTEGPLKVKIPKGSQSHTKFRLKGKGFVVGPNIGDLIATVKTETPKNLDEEYQKVIDQLAELEKKNITPWREKWSKNEY